MKNRKFVQKKEFFYHFRIKFIYLIMFFFSLYENKNINVFYFLLLRKLVDFKISHTYTPFTCVKFNLKTTVIAVCVCATD